MNAPLKFRSGNRTGRNFQIKCVQRADVVSEGGAKVGNIVEWEAVGVRSVKKQSWQDQAGNWRDSVHFYELAPSDEENRIQLDEFFVEGRFKVVRTETDVQRALAAWHEFEPR